MAEPEPVEQSSGGGFFSRLKAGFKRITPGEWALIGIGLLGIVVYFVWYRSQQGSSGSTTAGSTTNPDPQWQNAQADPNGMYTGELASLLTYLASITPNTSAPTSSATGGGTSGTASSAAGSSAADVDSVIPTVHKSASSGAGISLQSSNASPIMTTSQLVQAAAPAPAPAHISNTISNTGSANGTPGSTGNVGVPVRSSPASSPVRVPPNVTTGGQVNSRTVQTAGSQPTRRPPAGVRPA